MPTGGEGPAITQGLPAAGGGAVQGAGGLRIDRNEPSYIRNKESSSTSSYEGHLCHLASGYLQQAGALFLGFNLCSDLGMCRSIWLSGGLRAAFTVEPRCDLQDLLNSVPGCA